jgi:hypothetical protein
MNDALIFCQSYPQRENALYLVTRELAHRPVTIAVISNKALFKFFQAINDRVWQNRINIIFFEVYQGKAGKALNRLKKAFPYLLNTVREKLYLRNIYYSYFANLKEVEVFFFGRCFDPYQFYMLKRLSKANRLVYMHDPSYVTLISKCNPNNLIDLVRYIRCKLLYGFDIMMSEVNYSKGVPCMPDKFLRTKVSQVIDREERDNLVKDFDLSAFRVFDAGDYRVMYFHQDLVEDGYITDAGALRRELTEIFNVLTRHIPGSHIAYKYHPNFAGDRSIIEVGGVLPDWIPAEFLRNDNVKIYLSVFSLSIANLEKGVAISLLDLITLKDNQKKEELKEFLRQASRSEILFPKSLDEFEKIIISLKGP